MTSVVAEEQRERSAMRRRSAPSGPSRTVRTQLLVLVLLVVLLAPVVCEQPRQSPSAHAYEAYDEDAIMHFSGLRELSGKSYKSFKNRFRRHLSGVQCLKYHEAGNWWHYEWCVDASVRQYHPVGYQPTSAGAAGREQEASVVLGRYATGTPQVLRIHSAKNLSRLRNPDYSGYYAQQQYARGDACDAADPSIPQQQLRAVDINYKCCVYRANETYIEEIQEPALCQYTMTVCTPMACGLMQKDQYVLGASMRVSEEERLVLAATVKDMFYHAYYGYLDNAYPLDALLPISCRGETFELGKIQMLTLIDTLDTLAILQDAKEFQHAVNLVVSRADFDLDTEVSVFETTIRVLGGLLSAHLFAVDAKLALYPPGVYKNELLQLAIDLGDRLMPAFKTPTGIPYGTVNLRKGVPVGETTIASTAGAGSLSMEFTMLSVLTSDPKYANAARGAVRALYQRRSSLGLLGKHIDTKTGDWTETISGPGSNSDSFYEYLFKMYMTFNDEESLEMFASVYPAVLQHNLHGDWYADVSMWSGCGHGSVVFENLAAFWPGMQASVGHLHSATKSMNSFYRVWRDFGFIPEQFNVLDWKPQRGRGSRYPLRPELIESTFYMHEATGDSSWLRAGAHFVHSLQKHAKTKCGYATIADIETKEQEDNMPSFFLSETCKYLILLFDTSHFYRNGNYVMTTEAHPFPILPASLVDPIIFAEQLAAANQSSVAATTTTTATTLAAEDGGVESATTTTVPAGVGLSAYKMKQLQCLPQKFWDLLNYQVVYESAAVARTERCQPATTSPNSLKTTTLNALPTATSAQSHKQQQKEKKREGNLDTLESWLPELERRLGKTVGKFKVDGTLTTASIDDLVKMDSSADPKDHAWVKSFMDENREEFFGKKSFKSIYGGARFGQFRIDQLEHSMRFTREDTGEWLESSGIGDAVHVLVSSGKEQQRIDFDFGYDDMGATTEILTKTATRHHLEDDLDAELESTRHLVYEMKHDLTLPVERSCRLNVLVSSQREHPPELRYSFPCVGAGFGFTDRLARSQKFPMAEIEIAKPLDACGWLANDHVKGKIVVVTRGVCFFESKARNAARRGALGIIVVNNEDGDRIMVMGGSGTSDDAAGDDEKVSGDGTPITESEIPVVMVPQRLGAWFDRQLSVAAENGEQLMVEIELTVRDTTQPSFSQGGAQFPYAVGTADNLRVFGPEWGVHMHRTIQSDGQQQDSYTIAIVETPVETVTP